MATQAPNATQPVPPTHTQDAHRGHAGMDVALLIVRIAALGLLLHGLHKATGYQGFIDTLSKNPVGAMAPGIFGMLVVAGQLLLPIGIILGLLTRLCGGLMALMMASIAFLWTVPAQGWFSKNGGLSFEGSLYYLVLGLVLLVAGAGRLSLDHAIFARRRARRAQQI